MDRETGLVWERSPSIATKSWDEARLACIIKNVGGRKAWRLPSIPELSSLIDPSVASPPGPTLPSGHPFLDVQTELYWSAATTAVSPLDAWIVLFLNGGMGTDIKTVANHVWCVRGAMNADVY